MPHRGRTCLISHKYIIRRVHTSRLKSKLYCFNCFGMLRTILPSDSLVRANISSALRRSSNPKFHLPTRLLPPQWNLHDRHASPRHASPDHLRRGRKPLPNTPLRLTSANFIQLQKYPKQHAPHSSYSILRRLTRHTDIVGGQFNGVNGVEG